MRESMTCDEVMAYNETNASDVDNDEMIEGWTRPNTNISLCGGGGFRLDFGFGLLSGSFARWLGFALWLSLGLCSRCRRVRLVDLIKSVSKIR